MGRPGIIVFGVALIVGLSFQGSRGLFESTEGRYSLCAREMSDSGRWFEPTLLGRPHWTKPPLAYWMIAAGTRLLGRNAWGARLGNVIAFALTAVLVYGLGGMLWDWKTGFLAGLFYGTSLYPAAVAFTVNTDTLLTFWETLAIFLFWKAERTEAFFRRRAWYGVCGLALSGAFLTKGPPGLIAAVPMVLYRLHRGVGGDRRAGGGGLWVLASFLPAGLSWYLYETHLHPELWSYWIRDEIVGRVAKNEFHRNPEWWRPFAWYLPALLFGGGPWSWYLWEAARERRLTRFRVWKRILRRRSAGFFLAAWVVPGLAVFWVSSSRMLTYVLPLFPAMALVMARQARTHWPDGREFPRQWLRVAGVMALVLISFKALAGWALPPRPEDMGRLYRLWRRYDDPRDTVAVLVFIRRDLGANFYAESPVLRWSPEGYGSAVPEGLRSFLRRKAPGAKRIVFIARRKQGRAKKMLALVRCAGFPILKTWGDRNWMLVLAAAPAPRPRAPAGAGGIEDSGE